MPDGTPLNLFAVGYALDSTLDFVWLGMGQIVHAGGPALAYVPMAYVCKSVNHCPLVPVILASRQ